MTGIPTAIQLNNFKQNMFDWNKLAHKIDGTIRADDSGSTDAFGRWRVSNPHTIFESKMISDKQPLFFDEVTNGTGSAVYNTNEASVTMSVDTDEDFVIRQTFMRFNYQSGKSQQILMTGIIGEPIADTESRIGYFNSSIVSPYTDNRDGIYFGQDGTNNYVAISFNGTENKVVQANWNLDAMDGSGPSGITMNFDLVQIFMIDFEWLGVGRVRVGFVIDGKMYYCHEFNHANITGQTTVYMTSPNHSVRYEIYSSGGASSIKQICSSVVSEGGVEPSGVTRSIGNGITPVACGNTLEGILFVRLNASKLCSGIIPQSISILNTSNNTVNYRIVIILNPTIAGTALTWNNLSNSAIDYAVGTGDNTLTNGTTLYEEYTSGDFASNSFGANLVIVPGSAINGTQDIFAIAVQTLTAVNNDFVAALNIRELTCG